MSSPATGIKGYVPQLDGIRGLAIILVILYHYLGNIPIFSFGWCGVDLFFVLSGYLITSRLLVFRQQKNDLAKFYQNRALRLLPLYYLALILFYAGFNLLVKNENLYLFKFYNDNWLSFTFFFQNWSLIYFGDTKENFLYHFWSLAVEEQFYLVWPFFLYKFWGKRFFFSLVVFIIILVIITRTFLYIQYPDLTNYKHFYYNTFCRMDSFLIGACLLLFTKRNDAKKMSFFYLPALLIVVAGIAITGNASNANPFMSTIGFTLIAIIFAGLIFAAATNSSKIISVIFNYRWLKFTGKISYGLYIFHWIILIALASKLKQWLASLDFNKQIAYGLSLLTCLVISYIISAISYYYFELYFLKRKAR